MPIASTSSSSYRPSEKDSEFAKSFFFNPLSEDEPMEKVEEDKENSENTPATLQRSGEENYSNEPQVGEKRPRPDEFDKSDPKGKRKAN